MCKQNERCRKQIGNADLGDGQEPPHRYQADCECRRASEETVAGQEAQCDPDQCRVQGELPGKRQGSTEERSAPAPPAKTEPDRPDVAGDDGWQRQRGPRRGGGEEADARDRGRSLQGVEREHKYEATRAQDPADVGRARRAASLRADVAGSRAPDEKPPGGNAAEGVGGCQQERKEPGRLGLAERHDKGFGGRPDEVKNRIRAISRGQVRLRL